MIEIIMFLHFTFLGFTGQHMLCKQARQPESLCELLTGAAQHGRLHRYCRRRIPPASTRISPYDARLLPLPECVHEPEVGPRLSPKEGSHNEELFGLLLKK